MKRIRPLSENKVDVFCDCDKTATDVVDSEHKEEPIVECPDCCIPCPPQPPFPPEPPCPPIPPGPPSTDLVGRVYAPTYVSAYGIAVKYGYKGTEEEWIHSIESNTEHDKLIHREYPDSHPIEAISGLEDNLYEIDADIDELDVEIQKKQDTMLPMTVQDILEICT